MMHFRSFAAVAAVGTAAALAFEGGIAAQQTPRFRSSVDVIQVDVSAVDRNGRPVKGLTASDFTLLENGKPQDVVGFSEILVPAAPAQPAAWLRNVPPDARSNDLGDGRLFAIVMDDATMPPDLRIAANARQIGKGIIERMGPGDLAAVIFVTDSRRSVDFTNDRGRLLAAINGFTPGFAFADRLFRSDVQFYFASIRTINLVTARLARVPQRRKAVIYVSTGVPVEPTSIVKAGQLAATTLQMGVSVPNDPNATTNSELNGGLLDALEGIIDPRSTESYDAAVQDAFIRAQHGNVNIYSIDPGGLGGMLMYLQANGRNKSGALMTPAEADSAARMNQDFLVTIANNSGGRAVVNSNNLENGLERVFEDNSSYYLLGYEPARGSDARGVRSVTVRVNRPGVSAQTRNAYYRPSETAPAVADAAALETRLTSTLADVLPNPGVTLRAAAAPFALPDGRASLAVAIGVSQNVLGDTGAQVNERLDVLSTAFTPDGKSHAWVRQTVKATLRAGLPGPATYDVLSRIDLDPGRYQIRVAAHSNMTGKTGSIYLDVVVPSFTRDALAASGLVLWSTPTPPAAPGDAAAAFLPVVPTSQRTFSADDVVGGFLRVYQGGTRPLAPVTMKVTITDGNDHVVRKSSEVIAVDRFSGRQADYEVDVPVGELLGGEYLLTIEASQAGKSVKRDLRFTVK